jgi:hypothetical protein
MLSLTVEFDAEVFSNFSIISWGMSIKIDSIESFLLGVFSLGSLLIITLSFELFSRLNIFGKKPLKQSSAFANVARMFKRLVEMQLNFSELSIFKTKIK